jgi:hypothetical protein
MAQDRLLEALQRFAGLDPELVHQFMPGMLVGVERVRLTVGAIEREHLLGAQPFPEWMLADEHQQLTEDLLVTSQREIAVDPVHERGDPQFVQLRYLVAADRFEGQSGQRGAAPDCKRLLQQL